MESLKDKKERLLKELAEVEKELDTVSLWVPEEGSIYYYFTAIGDVRSTIYYGDSRSDKSIVAYFGAHQTKEQAERHALRTQAFNEICAWRDLLGKGNYQLHYHTLSGGFEIYQQNTTYPVPLGFKTRDAAQTCLDNLSHNAEAFLKGEL